VQRSEKLSRALNKLTADLQQTLHNLGEEPRHDALLAWNWRIPLDETTLKLRLELDSGSHQKDFFLVTYAALDRKLCFTPTLPNLHFELLPGQSLEERATAVLTRHLRDREKEEFADIDTFALQGKARVTVIEIQMVPGARAKKPAKSKLAFLFGGEEKKSGQVELRKVGRPLHMLYPDDLDRAIGRDKEVAELARLLAGPDRRPVVLVGPRKVGKTTILHELAWQIASRKKERFAGAREIWLISPMRLISGMSYLGEWENRVMAILDYASEKDRVLYFDDLLGLLTAGMHSASDLNVAQVLKPALEKRTVRVIAEVTPESWRVLRERNRAFAELFQVIQVNEPSEAETMRVLVNVSRLLEEGQRCTFGIDVVPTVCELQRRFASDAAFPGKAASFLKILAARHPNNGISRDVALREFREQSGLQLAFLDGRKELARESIITALGQSVKGQPQVLVAFADILTTLKARLNDPARPLGTLLLLGPTGVGKTQSAKALASYLFGSAERLLRFDLNEYVDGAAAARLVGTPREPEGLLTGAIRRQPFSVVLFDEIEKAAPEVFDLLLAVLDEGRLTDALGRVADFTNAVILLTSNLGVREAASRMGFSRGGDNAAADDAVFVSAAEKFFRPEFFNRIDRVIPFRTLDAEQLEAIARQALGEVLAREGLKRRECLLCVMPAAITKLVELGHHPQLGARALKRVIEREAAQPIAERLAAIPPGTPMIVNFGTRNGEFVIDCRELRPVERSIVWPEKIGLAGKSMTPAAAKILDAVYAALDRIEPALELDAPTGRAELGNMPPEHARYFACREQFKKVERLAQAAERSVTPGRKSPGAPRVTRAKPVKVVLRQAFSGNLRYDRKREAAALLADLSEWESAETVELTESPLAASVRELSLLEAMAATPADFRPATMAFAAVRPEDLTALADVARLYRGFFENIWGGSALPVMPRLSRDDAILKEILRNPPLQRFHVLFLEGANLRRLAPRGSATILVRRSSGSLGVIVTELLDLDSLDAAKSFAQSLGDGTLLKSEDATSPFGPVVQMVSADDSLTDFRTGLSVSQDPSDDDFRAFMLSALPLPPELRFLET
jgi:ATP-dependent Clp protease ATP-binding subunit ClpC